MEKVSIIIPCVGVMPNLNLLEKELEGLDYEIIVQKDRRMEGKGITLQKGFKRSKGDRIVWLDADFQVHPRHIKKFLKLNVDLIVSSKLHPKSQLQYTLPRKIITWLSCLVSRILFNLPLRDTQTGLKVFKRKVLEGEWFVKGFGHDIEVLTRAYHKGFTMVEMPVNISGSIHSTVSLKACFKTLYEMLWLKWGMIKNG